MLAKDKRSMRNILGLALLIFLVWNGITWTQLAASLDPSYTEIWESRNHVGWVKRQRTHQMLIANRQTTPVALMVNVLRINDFNVYPLRTLRLCGEQEMMGLLRLTRPTRKLCNRLRRRRMGEAVW